MTLPVCLFSQFVLHIVVSASPCPTEVLSCGLVQPGTALASSSSHSRTPAELSHVPLTVPSHQSPVLMWKESFYITLDGCS